MCAKSILLLFSILLTYVESASFDQRQTGNLNVQVDLKDIHIIALMKGGKEEYVDYDYAYDYSEMTIKPQNGSTTSKPLNATATDTENDSTISTTVFEPSTEAIKNYTWSSAETTMQTTITVNSQPVDTSSSTEKSTEVFTDTASTPTISYDKNITVVQTALNSTECKKGFVLNLKGDCELKLQGTGNALLKLVKLSQRLKLKRENRRNQNHST